jgi:hypothetical protein
MPRPEPVCFTIQFSKEDLKKRGKPAPAPPPRAKPAPPPPAPKTKEQRAKEREAERKMMFEDIRNRRRGKQETM